VRSAKELRKINVEKISKVIPKTFDGMKSPITIMEYFAEGNAAKRYVLRTLLNVKTSRISEVSQENGFL